MTECKSVEVDRDSSLESDDDFIDPLTFKGIVKNKKEISSDDYNSNSHSSDEEDNKPINENIKRINLTAIKKARYYS